MNFKGRIREIANRIDALSLRERAMLMVGAFMVLFLLWDWLLMADIERQRQRLTTEMETVRERVTQLNQAIARASQSRSRDPNVLLREDLQATQARIDTLDRTLAARSGQIIPPDEMAKVLEQILRRQGRLKLVSAESVPPTSLFSGSGADGVPGSVYKHGLALEVEGRYMDVLEYLRDLESLEWQFFWDAVELESDDFPTNRVRIRIYTLNLEEGWLGV